MSPPVPGCDKTSLVSMSKAITNPAQVVPTDEGAVHLMKPDISFPTSGEGAPFFPPLTLHEALGGRGDYAEGAAGNGRGL